MTSFEKQEERMEGVISTGNGTLNGWTRARYYAT